MHIKEGLIFALFSTLALIGLRAERTSPNPYSLIPNPNDSSRVVDLDEVIIVAQPKESGRLRTQPLSSTLFSAADMQDLGLRDIRDVSLYVPTFVMPEYGSRYTSSAYIRGIGAKEGCSAIGMYVDGIPLVTKSMYNQHLYALERIDVLRGAQGTLYGMNSEGGLVRLYSRNPMNSEGTDLRLGGGMYGQRQAEAAHHHRFSDRVALSVASFYDGTVFHRVIPNFMVQGGGFTADLVQKPTRPPVKNEADNGLRNVRGTIAMARTMVVDSATAQFFINTVDNKFLDFTAPNIRGYGYAVFGRVTAGMDVVDKIAAVQTGIRNGMRDVPLEPVVIKSIRRK